MRGMLATLVLVLCLPVTVHATIYYVSPTGSNSNNGTSSSTPWLTLSFAVSNSACGDTVMLLDGTYGDGTSTGKLSIANRTCTQASPYTVIAQNQRKAKIVDSGAGKAVSVTGSAWIIIDGIYARSTDLASSTSNGYAFFFTSGHHYFLRNVVGYNTNRYANTHIFNFQDTQDAVIEDAEGYTFHRHCILGWHGERLVARRVYCNPRGGGIPGGFAGTSSTIGKGDSLIAFYPCRDCVAENIIADGTTNSLYLSGFVGSGGGGISLSNNRLLGSICYRCASVNSMHIHPQSIYSGIRIPTGSILRDVAFIDYSATASKAVRASNNTGTLLDHITVIGASGGAGAEGLVADDTAPTSTAATNSITMTNSTVSNVTSAGFRVSQYNTWSGSFLNSFNNGTSFSPSLPSNWSNTSTIDPQFGTCKGVWVPDASPLKGAGSGGSDIGANVLYRYVDGVLTSTPLWDPTSGAFPHGAADADGINRVAGESLFDMHTRLNVNSGGCAFPSGYGGGGGAPTDPPGHHSSSGTSTIQDSVVVPSGLDHLFAFVLLRDAGGNVGTVTGVTSSCGGQSFTFGDRARTHPEAGAIHNIEGWQLASPSPGTCTITASTTGIVGSWIMDVFESSDGNGTPVWAANGSNSILSSVPTVTVPTNTNETIYSATSGSSSTTVSAGPDQTFLLEKLLSPMRLAVSTQSGSAGGVVDYVFGGNTFWATVAVSIPPDVPDPPSVSTFRVSNYRIDNLHGTAATPEVTLGPLAAQNTAGEIGATGQFRLRAEVIVENATSTGTGVHPYCKKVGGSFVRVADTFGSGFIRFYGPGAEPTIPASLTPTTQRFTGTFVPGKTSRTSGLSVVLPAMSANTRTELDYQFALGNGLVDGDTVECEIRRDDGGTLGVHTNPVQVKVVGPRASMGF